ncbi:MAG: SRPBCC family protein [Gemmatimonadota bacterium]
MRIPAAPAFAAILLATTAVAQEPAAIERPDVGAFAFEHVVVLPGTPAGIYDVITGDLSGWWDHNFSGDPAVFVLEPWPGGRFLEQFEEGSRDGLVHATVTFARRPELLRFEGPLGLTGYAVHGVYTYELEPVGDSTRLTLTTRMAGEMQEGWPEAVEGAWRHFLFERLKPYVEGGGS